LKVSEDLFESAEGDPPERDHLDPEDTRVVSRTVDWGSYRPPPSQMYQDVSDNRGLSPLLPIGRYENNLDWDGMLIGPKPLTEVPRILHDKEEPVESAACDSVGPDEGSPIHDASHTVQTPETVSENTVGQVATLEQADRYLTISTQRRADTARHYLSPS
jgi:hypothetical protein